MNLHACQLSGLILKHHVYGVEKVKLECKRYGIDEFDISIVMELIGHNFEESNPPLLLEPKRRFLSEVRFL